MTVFWLVTGALALLAAGLLMLAGLRARASEEPPAAYDLRVYRDQLKEVERDLARGVLSEADAERVRVEVSRRILAADAALQGPEATAPQSRTSLMILGVFAVLIVAGSFTMYLRLGAPGYGDMALADRIAMAETYRAERPDQATAEASMPPYTPPVNESPEYLALVGQLRETLAERDGDVRGYQLLAQSEARLGNFVAAHKAQERVLRLMGGPDAPIIEWTNYADFLVLATGGYVSPEAERVLEVVLSRDPQNGVARYYLGLMLVQTGRPDQAFRLWDVLLRAGPEDAPWIAPIVAQMDDVARLAGVEYNLPEIGGARGPTANDVEAAQDMSPAERLEMIEGMVAGLSDRLATEGGPPQDWARLITALGVLGRMGQADAIFDNAREVFGDSPGAMDIINRAAEQAGLI